MSGLKVKREMCPTCIFQPGNLMDLEPGRVKDMVNDCRRKDTHIICHETLSYGDGAEDGSDEAVCAGFLAAGNSSQMYRIAGRLNMIEVVS